MESGNNLAVAEAFELCEWQWEHIWFFTDSFILVTGVLANVAMLWVLLRDKNAFTASQVGAAQVIALKVGPPVVPLGGGLGVKPCRMNGGKCHTSDHECSTKTSNLM